MSEGSDGSDIGPLTGFAEGPEFWFDGTGHVWFGHNCNTKDREYSLPEAIYEVLSRDPLSIAQVVSCGLCGLRGNITDGQWIPLARKR